MKRMILMFLLSSLPGLTKMMGRARTSTLDLARLKVSLTYLKSIETARFLFISFMGMGACLVMFFVGLIMLNTVFFMYTSMSHEMKFLVGIGLAFGYIGASVMVFLSISSQAKWMEIFHAQNIISHLTEENESQSSDFDHPTQSS